MEIIVACCAGLDVHKDTVMACVRRWGPAGQRVQEVREFRTWTSALRELRAWLVAEEVTQVAMEATGVYWRPVWAGLEDLTAVELLLVNAHAVQKLPGRKTDVGDAAWLAQLLECGLLRGSFVPTPALARLRDLTRYRKKLIEDRSREILRVQKVLETAGVKLDSVVSDVMGKSARAMLAALVAGERDVDVMADLALRRLRPKMAELRLALEGRFTDHHALMLSMHLGHIDHLTGAIERLDTETAREIAPFADAVRRVTTIPGIAERTAQVVIAEIGVDMTRFPTAHHLASWAGLCPGNRESAGKRRPAKTPFGSPALRAALCEAAWCASRTNNTYLGAQFRRLARRFGKGNQNKAIVAVAHTMLVMIWHLLAHGSDYTELGADYFERHHDPAAQARRLVAQLERLGHVVTLTPAA